MPFSFSSIVYLVLASISPAIAQSLSAGIKAGVRLNEVSTVPETHSRINHI
jgi:hypothetical protein